MDASLVNAQLDKIVNYMDSLHLAEMINQEMEIIQYADGERFSVKATGRRPERLGDLIREEVSRLLIDGIKDPRIGMVNITEVDVSPDIKRAVHLL